MAIKNVEVKASCKNIAKIRKILKSKKARFAGTDHQTDTYFKVSSGRLKLREGTIENNLIYYSRPNTRSLKKSNILLLPVKNGKPLREMLAKSIGIKTVVDKKREIYYLENVKFHLDNVKGLGTFIEIEAIDIDGKFGYAKIGQQCSDYKKLLGIKTQDILSHSYSDMLLHKQNEKT